ncbi:MAG: arylesterase [Rhodanobacteraceae bacterium]
MRSCIRFCLVLLLWWCAPLAGAAVQNARPVLLLGDSLSAAHNIALTASWPVLLQVRLQEMRPPRALINASISGETTAAGLSRLPNLLKRFSPALVMIELGANDGLLGLPLDEIRGNLQAMIRDCGSAHAQVLLLGIELPVNYGPQYRDGLRGIYAQLAHDNHSALVPFLLQGIALHPELMQEDGLHPIAQAQPRVLANVWPALQPMLAKLTR